MEKMNMKASTQFIQRATEICVGKRNRGTFELMLDVLRLLDCPCRQYRLAGMVGSTNSRLAVLLPELEMRGLVSREGLLYARTLRGSEVLNFGFPEY